MTASSAPLLATDAILAIAALVVGVAGLLAHRTRRARRAAAPPSALDAPEVPGAAEAPVAVVRASARPSTTPAAAPATAPTPAPRPEGPIEALLAEDNDVNALVLTRHLEKLGCRITRTTTGAEAVAAVETGRFEILFMDWRMPEMDGLEAIRRIRRIDSHAHVPIVAVTANALPGDRETCLSAGADDYLTKPVDAASLRAVLTRHVPDADERAATATASGRATR